MRISEICEVTSSKRIFASQYTNSGVPFYRGKEITELSNKQKISTSLFISKSDFDIIDYKFGSPNMGDILVTAVGTIGNVYLVKNENFYFKDGNIIWIKNIKKNIVLPSYLYIYLKTPDIKNKFMELSIGSTQKALTIESFKNIEVNFPSLKNQQKIVKILSCLDTKIELNNNINNNLYEIADTLYNKLFIGEKEIRLEDLLDNIESGSREKGGAIQSGVPSIGAEKIERIGIYDFNNEKYISEEYFKKMKNGVAKSGDVLLYKDGAYAGKTSMVLNDFPHKECAINEHVFILRTKNNFANFYLYFLLNQDKVKKQLIAMAQSKAAQPGLNQVEVKSVKINAFDNELILEFENKVKPLMEKIIENSKQNNTLTKLRDTLLPKLMNGDIDLENIEI